MDDEKTDVEKFKDELQELMKKYPNCRLQTGHTIEVIDVTGSSLTYPGGGYKPIFK